MKKIILDKNEERHIVLSEIPEGEAIFLVRNKIVGGLLVKEEDKGWIIRIGGGAGATGYHKTRKLAMNASINLYPDTEFYIRPEINESKD